MALQTDIFAGLHVLLVSEDESRSQALSKALRERKANVGDVKSSARDPIALRGADLLVVDARSVEATKARVNEVRTDVRARWAAVATVDFTKLVLDGGAVRLDALEQAVSPLTAADRALTERAKKGDTFEAELQPLGPSRCLRALSMAGPTLHVELSHASLKASVDLSNELLIAAFAERGSERWEAWNALARILGLMSAKLRVSRCPHPAAMNVMEPLDQALEVAAQQRHTSAAELALEEATPAHSKTTDENAATGDHRGVRVELNRPLSRPPASALLKPGRTLMGVAPAGPLPLPGVPSKAASPSPLASPPATPPCPPGTPPGSSGSPGSSASRYAHRPEGGERVRPGRTMMGLAPGALPALGGLPKPAVQPPPPSAPRIAGDKPAVPGPAGAVLTVQPAADLLDEPRPTMPVPADQVRDLRASVAGQAADGARALAESEPAPAPYDAMPTLPAPPLEDGDQLVPLGRPRPVAPADKLQGVFNDAPTKRGDILSERLLAERSSFGDTPTDPAPPRAPGAALIELEPGGSDNDNDEESTTVTGGNRMEELLQQAEAVRVAREENSSGSTLGADFAGFVGEPRKDVETRPFDSRSLLTAIDEEAGKFSHPPGAAPLPERLHDEAPPAVPIVRRVAQRAKSRAGVLSLLLLCAAAEGGYLYWSKTQLGGGDDRSSISIAVKTTKPSASAPSAGRAAPAAPVAAEQPPATAAPAAAPPPSTTASAAAAVPSASADKPTAAAAPAPEQPPTVTGQAGTTPAAAAAAPAATPPAAAAAPAATAPAPAAEPAPSPAAAAPTQAAETQPSPAAGAEATGTAAATPTIDDFLRDGNRMLSERNAAGAKAAFESALALDGKNPHAHAGLGQALLDSGDARLALKSAEEAVRLRPKRARYRVLQGDALRALGRPDEARGAWEKALEIDPADREAQKRLGR